MGHLERLIDEINKCVDSSVEIAHARELLPDLQRQHRNIIFEQIDERFDLGFEFMYY
jgi:hypothetical protein